MKTPTKFVQPLTEEQREQLREIMQSQSPQRKRMRAHAILLSERRYSIDQIADIYQVDRDRVSEWLDWWDEYQCDGLDDDPWSGRPPKRTEKEQKHAVKLTRNELRSLRRGLNTIATKIGKTISRDTLKRILKAEEYGWKRLRRSVRSWRDEEEFCAAQAELADLRAAALESTRKFDLWYFDEAGFSSPPVCPTPGRKLVRLLNWLPLTALVRTSWAFSTCAMNFILLPLRTPLIPRSLSTASTFSASGWSDRRW